MEKDTKDKIEGNTVTENLNVEGKQVAFRDINNKNYFQNGQGPFLDLDIESIEDKNFVAPNFTHRLFNRLCKNRLLITAPPSSFDAASLLRYLAFRLSKEQELELRELDNNLENVSLLKELRKEEEGKIFIFDYIHPRSIDYDLSRLINLATQKDFYFLISTELSESVWQVRRNAFSNCWFTIPSQNIYEKWELEKDLVRKLVRDQSKIGFLKETTVSIETYLSTSIQVKRVAVSVNNPQQIDLFVYQLIGIDELPKDIHLEGKIERVTDESAPAIVKWFHTLSSTQKLIVIGACLLEGVYDDQFFQLMNEVAEKNWKFRDNSLLALDYCDLEFMHHYFEFDELGVDKRILKSRYAEQRISIIQAAWNSYRRHILHALPVFIDAARNTILSNEVNREKFGTQHRRMSIRQAIGGTVSDIGIHSLITVEHTLLEFASMSEVTLQRITAKAMARWREYGKDDLLFDTLERWVSNADIWQTVEEILKMERIASINKSQTSKALTYIKSTTVLTLGYAAAFDPPDELNDRLIGLMKTLISDEEPQVRNRLRIAIPLLIHLHTKKLLPFITEDVIKEDDLQDLVKDTLVSLYDDHPKMIAEVLAEWMEDCLITESEKNRRHKLTYRDKVLVTALQTYQELDLSSDNSVISIGKLYEQLTQLIQKERREGVVLEVRRTLIYLLPIDFKETEKWLPVLCPDPFSDEAELLAQVFSRIYFKERLALEDQTDFRLILSNQTEELPVWPKNVKRPLTSVEKGIQLLLESETLSNRQLAIRILWQFAKEVDKEEEDYLHLIKEPIPIEKEEVEVKEEDIQESVSTNVEKVVPKPKNPISLWMRIWIYLVCLREKDPYSVRKELAAFYVTIRNRGLKSVYTQFLLQKWRTHHSMKIRKLSKHLQFLVKRAFWW